MMGTEVSFGTVPPAAVREQRFGGFLAHQVRLLHAGTDHLAALDLLHQLRRAVEGGDQDLPVAPRRLDRAQRAGGRLVGLHEEAAHVGIGGEHVLHEAERLIRRVGLHLLQSGLLGDARLLHRLAESRGARLAVLARLADRHQPDGAAGPALLLHRRGERLADAVRALEVVGDHEGDVFAGIGADIGDDHRDVRALREAEHRRRGRAVGRRDADAGDAARDHVLRVLELRLRAVVAVEREEAIAGFARTVFSMPFDR